MHETEIELMRKYPQEQIHRMSQNDHFEQLTNLARQAPDPIMRDSAPPGFAESVVRQLTQKHLRPLPMRRSPRNWERLAFPGAVVAAAVALFAVFCLPDQTVGAHASDPVAAALAECIVVEALLE